MTRVDNSVDIWQNLPSCNPKPDLHSINAHTKFDKNPSMLTQVIIRKRKTDGYTSYRWTLVGYYRVKFSAQNTQTRCLNTQQVPQIYWVLTLDPYGRNGKYPIHIYPIYAHSCAQTNGRTDGRIDTQNHEIIPTVSWFMKGICQLLMKVC